MEIEEPEVTYKKLKIKDFWKRGRTTKVVTVSSGPLPEEKNLPATNPAREKTQGEIEETPSPTYPTDKLPIDREVPLGGVPRGNQD